MARNITLSVSEEDFHYLKGKKQAKTVREALNLHRKIKDQQSIPEEPVGWIKELKRKLAFFVSLSDERQAKIDSLREELKDVWVAEETVTKRRVRKVSKRISGAGVETDKAGGFVSILERDSKQETLSL